MPRLIGHLTDRPTSWLTDRPTSWLNSHRASHLLGWLICGVIAWMQSPGLIAADTKHDLAVDPAGFLRAALSPYTDTFTLGQLQNQAYGYLFPQGAFFAATDFLPDWVAQRLWWWIVLGVGFSGFYLLAARATGATTRAEPAGATTTPAAPSHFWLILAALSYALSPRALTTLTTISSETWPVMLAPWVIVPFVAQKVTWRQVAAAVVPVAAMGAVNAAATLAACLPAGIVVLYRRQFRAFGLWLIGCALVSIWWIGPLLILGRYAPPFTEFIESGFVTTRWLNLAEVLRGTTSWAPFVDTERTAGVLLVSEPVFVLATLAVAALGLIGLLPRACRCPLPHPAAWALMLCIGIAIFGIHAAVLDTALVPFRNLHKFDPLIRIPLCLGLASLRPRRTSVTAVVALIVISSTAPAWTGRLLPQGAYSAVPSYWTQAADFLNANARGTRTLIYPPQSFARQDWGWTRDEPAQPLLDVPWAVRDAIPLIPPEAIRSLDGVMDLIADDPQAGAQALQRLGIGAVIVRSDELDTPNKTNGADESNGAKNFPTAEDFPGTVHHFGKIDVVMLPTQPHHLITEDPPMRVAGGGESLALLDSLHGPTTYELVKDNADIVTDTPLLTDRNYGTLTGPVSAPLAPDDPTTSNNRLRDYPSAGPLTTVVSHGGQVAASSSAADASSFGGTDPARSVTAAVDGDESTAWWPTPGDRDPWIELRGDFPAPRLNITATGDTPATIHSAGASVDVDLRAGQEVSVPVPGGASSAVRVNIGKPVGITSLSIAGHPIERVVTVPDTSPQVRQFVFSRLWVDTGVLIRDFTAPRNMEVTLTSDGDAPVDIDGERVVPTEGTTVSLSAGRHRLRTDAKWVTLTEPGFTPPPTTPVPAPDTAADTAAADSAVATYRIDAADSDRLLITGHTFNPGLRARLNGQELIARQVDAATQAYEIPAGARGVVTETFAATGLYRWSLFGGGIIGLITMLGCAFVARLGRRSAGEASPDLPSAAAVAAAPVAAPGVVGIGTLCLGLYSPYALVAGIIAAAITRWTTIPARLLIPGLVMAAGAMLARAPWPSADYAGDSLLVSTLCAGAVGALLYKFVGGGRNRDRRRHRRGQDHPKVRDITAKQRDSQDGED